MQLAFQHNNIKTILALHLMSEMSTLPVFHKIKSKISKYNFGVTVLINPILTTSHNFCKISYPKIPLWQRWMFKRWKKRSRYFDLEKGQSHSTLSHQANLMSCHVSPVACKWVKKCTPLQSTLQFCVKLINTSNKPPNGSVKWVKFRCFLNLHP